MHIPQTETTRFTQFLYEQKNKMVYFPNRNDMYIYVNLLVLHQTTKKLQILVVHEKGIVNTRVILALGNIYNTIFFFSATETNKKEKKPETIP